MAGDNRGNGGQLSYGEMVPKLEPDDTEGKPVALTIRRARRQNMSRNPNRDDTKIIITFAEEFEPRAGFEGDAATKREYVVNATSYKTLCMKLGNDDEKWIGKQIVMALTTTKYEDQTFEKMHVATPDRWDKVLTASAKATSKRR